MRRPRSTYRLQIDAAFTLDHAAEAVPYLHRLGVDGIYLSPLLRATRGSRHGYDVVDHREIDPERGGAAGLDRLAEAAHAHGLAVLVDIVPNHMGVADAAQNPAWWELLRGGAEGPRAGWFDVDWEAGDGRVRLPVLGEDLEEAAASGALRVVAAEPDAPSGEAELRYHEHRYPVAAGTGSPGDPLAVHARQHYELVDWRRADHELNYRRFFAVNELAAIRVERDEVFDATHAEILRWVREGLVDGLRVDHPDGLADPGGYLARLRDELGDGVLLVEKILEPGERLPAFWPVDGTTGYDALGEFDRVLVDPAGEEALDALEVELGGVPGSAWGDLVHGTKRGIADGILGSEVRRLVREFRRAAPTVRGLEPGDDADRAEGAGAEVSDDELVDAVAEVLACVPVYRSYLPTGAEHLDEALAESRRRRPDLSAALELLDAPLHEPASALARRFQQTSGVVMAKGVEDTALYRTSRLTALTEVGGDPSVFALAPHEFHDAQQRRLAAWPASMTTLSTHDTKRGEDTRARLLAIAEAPEEWAAFLRRRRARAPLRDGVLENLLWQAIVGSWPREREALHGYAEKAAREAGDRTEWTDPDDRFESGMHRLVDTAFDDAEARADVEQIVARLEGPGRSNGLALKLLQLTGPGLPDVYQGSELWERSLVDPDNRRPVDLEQRSRLLTALDEGWEPVVDETGAAKLAVVARTLRLRRDHPELFGGYRPLDAVGPAARHALAVDRGGAIALVTRRPLGLAESGGWHDTSLPLPAGRYRDALRGAVHEVGDPSAGLSLAAVLNPWPVALLVREDV
ncbi:MAG: malto-oligosyltrehalose synthase [Actinomycetales bacterium]|nr:malto-oligosyltrehalose synthase [Actinomycetales bacterium]